MLLLRLLLRINMLIAFECWVIMCQSETHNDRVILTGWWGFHVPAFTHYLCSVAPPSVLYCFLIIQNFKLHLFTSFMCMGRVPCLCARSHCLAGERAIAYPPQFIHLLMGVGAVSSLDSDEWNSSGHLCSSHLVPTLDPVAPFHFTVAVLCRYVVVPCGFRQRFSDC